MTEISACERDCLCNNARKLDSMSSVTKRGLPSSSVAPMNCNKQGWRHLEAMFISLSNKRLLWGDIIISWNCFTATLQPLNLPSITVPHPPTPRQVSVRWISSREMTQWQGSFSPYSLSFCWAADNIFSRSMIRSSLALNSLSKLTTLRSASSLACFCSFSSSCSRWKFRRQVRFWATFGISRNSHFLSLRKICLPNFCQFPQI